MQQWLDRRNSPISAAEARQFLMDTEYVQVARTRISTVGGTVEATVSTIWTGRVSSLASPQIFETHGDIRQGDAHSQYHWNFESDALAGHESLVAQIAHRLPIYPNVTIEDYFNGNWTQR